MFLIYIFTGASQSAHEAPLVPGVHMHRLLHRSRPGNLRLEIFSLTLLNLGRYREIEVSVFFRYLEPRPGNLRLLFAEATFEGKARRWTRSGDPDSVVACVYIYIYIYVCLFNLRHTPPAIEREISSGGAVGRFGNEPAQAPRLVFLDGGVIFESLVGAGVGITPPTDIGQARPPDGGPAPTHQPNSRRWLHSQCEEPRAPTSG